MKFVIANNLFLVNYRIFLVQTYHNRRVYWQIFAHFQKFINYIVDEKYHQLSSASSLHRCELKFQAHLVFAQAIFEFQVKYKISFANFLAKKLRWSLLNLWRSTILSHQSELHFIYDKTDYLNSVAMVSLTQKPSFQLNQLPTKLHYAQFMKNLTILEKTVFDYKIHDLPNRYIVQATDYSPRQIDNAWERIKKKSKSYII